MKHSHSFLKYYVKVRENSKKLWKQSPADRVPAAQTSTRVYITRWKHGTCFLFLKYKMKMIDSPLRSFCKISDESLEHLLCRCDFSATFWKSVVLWLKSLHIAIDSLNDCDTVFGLAHKSSHWLLLNHIIIAGKIVIYHIRLKNILPSLRFRTQDHIESIERSIAIKNNRLKIHEGK